MIQNIENLEKCYIAIEYPAQVNNIDAAFKTLGGEETVRQVRNVTRQNVLSSFETSES